ncbi:bacillithiol system redox-active protein YtxJ [Thalassobacillus sp. CUG 92003]|uniref:bacillithiol system redox-active protein YtxJ n=1 Tax=Thalassobacillus sp. CUG 92003 TaxID=2736641 RepID=UPI0015E70E00
MTERRLSSIEDFQQAQKNEGAFWLLKHSLTCPISASAKKEFENYTERTHLPSFILHVQDSRALSNHIATDQNVKHESPQALLFENGSVRWHDSHGGITHDALEKAEKSFR